MGGRATALRSKSGERRVLGDRTQEPMCFEVGRAKHGRTGGGDRGESGLPAEVDSRLQVRAGREFYIQIPRRCLAPSRQGRLVV